MVHALHRPSSAVEGKTAGVEIFSRESCTDDEKSFEMDRAQHVRFKNQHKPLVTRNNTFISGRGRVLEAYFDMESSRSKFASIRITMQLGQVGGGCVDGVSRLQDVTPCFMRNTRNREVGNEDKCSAGVQGGYCAPSRGGRCWMNIVRVGSVKRCMRHMHLPNVTH